MKRLLLVLVAAVSATGIPVLPVQLSAAEASRSAVASLSSPAASLFRNCTALHRVYPHGVGKYGARDHTSGTPVTNFRRSNALYRLNRGLDRDKDGIACEAP
jgi:hypothetical protein